MLEGGHPELPDRLEALIDPITRGNPKSQLPWPTGAGGRSRRRLPEGHPVSSWECLRDG